MENILDLEAVLYRFFHLHAPLCRPLSARTNWTARTKVKQTGASRSDLQPLVTSTVILKESLNQKMSMSLITKLQWLSFVFWDYEREREFHYLSLRNDLVYHSNLFIRD